MRRLALGLVGLLLGALAVSAPASAATADGGALTVRTQDVSLWAGQCGNALVTLAGDLQQDPHWDVTVTVSDPRGQWVDAALLDESSTARSMATRLCADSDPQGTYRVVAEYVTYDSAVHATAVRRIRSDFTLGTRTKDASTATTTRSPLGAHRWLVSGTLRRANSTWADEEVVLQARRGGVWRDVATSSTSARGTVSFIAKARAAGGRSPMRLHAAGDSHVQDATSATFRLPRR